MTAPVSLSPPGQEPWYVHAVSIAQRLHHGRTTPAGRPYWTYCAEVGRVVASLSPAAPRHVIEAAVLHGVLDNGRVQPNQLRALGISADVTALIQALSRDPDLSYPEWVETLAASGNAPAILIECACVMVRIFPDDLALAARNAFPDADTFADDVNAFATLTIATRNL